jgi:tight adherence protein B
VRTVISAVLAGATVWCLIPSRTHERAAALLGGASPKRPAVGTMVRGRLKLGFGPSARRRAARDRARTVQALGALAAELEAGGPPATALLTAGGDPSVWPTAAAAVPLGEDLVAALVQDADRRPPLRMLAACWQVSTASGSGFAEAVGRLASSARASEAVRVDLEGELAGPRATARMLCVLPAIGVGFGVMLGSDPLAWMLTSVPGLACLLTGLGLTIAGGVWTGRIAASVERLL